MYLSWISDIFIPPPTFFPFLLSPSPSPLHSSHASCSIIYFSSSSSSSPPSLTPCPVTIPHTRWINHGFSGGGKDGDTETVMLASRLGNLLRGGLAGVRIP